MKRLQAFEQEDGEGQPPEEEEYYRSNINSDMEFAHDGRETTYGRREPPSKAAPAEKIEIVPLQGSGVVLRQVDAELVKDFEKDMFVERKSRNLVAGCTADSRVFDSNISMLFFPGMIFHELAHYLALKLAGARIIDVKLWSVNMAYVRYGEIVRSFNIVITCLAPLLLGAVFSALVMSSAVATGFGANAAISWILLWIAVSVAIYAPMSLHDGAMMTLALRASYKRRAESDSIADKLLSVVFLLPYYASLFVLSTGIFFWVFQYLFVMLVLVAMGALKAPG